MAIEIERKFLIDQTKWAAVPKGEGIAMKQGYLVIQHDRTIRIRIADQKAFLTIKGKTSQISRPEFEYEIPVGEANQMLELMAGNIIEKKRFKIKHDQHIWEVDVFEGDNDGLFVAEIELSSENEAFTIPNWVTTEVSDDKRYYNAHLTTNPYKNWRN
jgi:adenylate cyclase